eukprot:TRINITY_DN50591_c0_g1_i1.p1 TRINITY_DN50591_c0_g1~~TRINITY_DN50591_c0_g1_i1.p1  ORF type:complete len:346 (-),score=40.15 TRINITY_DN50591_c0_g1_i1:231-1130(-)
MVAQCVSTFQGKPEFFAVQKHPPFGQVPDIMTIVERRLQTVKLVFVAETAKKGECSFIKRGYYAWKHKSELVQVLEALRLIQSEMPKASTGATLQSTTTHTEILAWINTMNTARTDLFSSISCGKSSDRVATSTYVYMSHLFCFILIMAMTSRVQATDQKTMNAIQEFRLLLNPPLPQMQGIAGWVGYEQLDKMHYPAPANSSPFEIHPGWMKLDAPLLIVVQRFLRERGEASFFIDYLIKPAALWNFKVIMSSTIATLEMELQDANFMQNKILGGIFTVVFTAINILMKFLAKTYLWM